MTIPHRKTLTRRLVTLWQQATPEEMAEGMSWYDAAYSLTVAMSEQYGHTPTQCAYVIAALSPNTSWVQNMAAAVNACEGHRDMVDPSFWKGVSYPANKYKARDILDGDLTALSGPKVTQFGRAIAGDPDACTVDIWMQRACDMPSDSAPNKTQHKAIRKAIESGARAADVSVRDFQAVVWTVIRNRNRSVAQRNA